MHRSIFAPDEPISQTIFDPSSIATSNNMINITDTSLDLDNLQAISVTSAVTEKFNRRLESTNNQLKTKQIELTRRLSSLENALQKKEREIAVLNCEIAEFCSHSKELQLEIGKLNVKFEIQGLEIQNTQKREAAIKKIHQNNVDNLEEFVKFASSYNKMIKENQDIGIFLEEIPKKMVFGVLKANNLDEIDYLWEILMMQFNQIHQSFGMAIRKMTAGKSRDIHRGVQEADGNLPCDGSSKEKGKDEGNGRALGGKEKQRNPSLEESGRESEKPEQRNSKAKGMGNSASRNQNSTIKDGNFSNEQVGFGIKEHQPSKQSGRPMSNELNGLCSNELRNSVLNENKGFFLENGEKLGREAQKQVRVIPEQENASVSSQIYIRDSFGPVHSISALQIVDSVSKIQKNSIRELPFKRENSFGTPLNSAEVVLESASFKRSIEPKRKLSWLSSKSQRSSLFVLDQAKTKELLAIRKELKSFSVKIDLLILRTRNCIGEIAGELQKKTKLQKRELFEEFERLFEVFLGSKEGQGKEAITKMEFPEEKGPSAMTWSRTWSLIEKNESQGRETSRDSQMEKNKREMSKEGEIGAEKEMQESGRKLVNGGRREWKEKAVGFSSLSGSNDDMKRNQKCNHDKLSLDPPFGIPEPRSWQSIPAFPINTQNPFDARSPEPFYGELPNSQQARKKDGLTHQLDDMNPENNEKSINQIQKESANPQRNCEENSVSRSVENDKKDVSFKFEQETIPERNELERANAEISKLEKENKDLRCAFLNLSGAKESLDKLLSKTGELVELTVRNEQDQSPLVEIKEQEKIIEDLKRKLAERDHLMGIIAKMNQSKQEMIDQVKKELMDLSFSSIDFHSINSNEKLTKEKKECNVF